MEKFICPNCGKDTLKHAKGLCTTCYKKLVWKPKKHKCKKCGRTLPHHAKGLCGGCYNTLFHLDYNKNRNYEKYHNIKSELYREITQKCLICGFSKVVELHHLDNNHKNSLKENLIGLCPNHHKMIHIQKFREEVLEEINKILKTQKEFS